MQFALISADADAIYCLTAMRYVAKATRYTLRRDIFAVANAICTYGARYKLSRPPPYKLRETSLLVLSFLVSDLSLCCSPEFLTSPHFTLLVNKKRRQSIKYLPSLILLFNSLEFFYSFKWNYHIFAKSVTADIAENITVFAES